MATKETNEQTEAQAHAKVEELAEVYARHAAHAKERGLKPGHTYNAFFHNVTTPVSGKLVGTNDVGVLLHRHGSKHASFHPWSGLHTLAHEEDAAE